MWTARPVAALLLLAGSAGCAAEGQGTILPAPSTRAVAPSGGLVAGCEDAVAQQERPGDTYRVVAGVVAVPASDQLLQPAEQTLQESPTRLFAKWGLLVRTGTTVELSLLPGWGDRARIRWGRAGFEPSTAITIVSCPPAPGKNPATEPGENPTAEAGTDPAAEPGEDPAAKPGTNPTAGPGESSWSVFTGGTWVAEPDCVPIRITTETEQVTVELSVGTPCSRPGG